MFDETKRFDDKADTTPTEQRPPVVTETDAQTDTPRKAPRLPAYVTHS